MLFGHKIVAVCMTKIHQDTLREFITHFNAELVKHNWRVFVYTCPSDLYWKTKSNIGEKAVFDLINFAVTDAVVVFQDKILDPSVTEQICSRAKENQVPTFVMGGDREDCCNVCFDYEQGFVQVLQHLIDCHHVTDFHYMAGFQDNAFSDTRKAVMQKLLAERGIPFDESRVSYGNFWSIPSKLATEQLIADNRVPQAIVCANDSMAISVCSTLVQHGYRVPEDVIVTGFDGIDAIHFSTPRITSCKCDYRKLGEKTAQLVVQSERPECLPRTVLLTPQLLLSESCGCVAHEAVDAVDFYNALTDSFRRFRNEEAKLNELTATIQGCSSTKEITEALHSRIFYDMCCVLKTECINNTLPPLKIHSETTFGEELYVLSDTDVAPDFQSYVISAEDIIPRLPNVLEKGIPLIFIALHFIEIPLGYLCFHFCDTDKQNYLKVNQTAGALNSAIGGYRNIQYQYHLQAMVEDMYKYDALTGLHNRNGFLRKYREMVEHRDFEEITIILCDLDGLKYINDNFSHYEGDNALSVVADALHTACRDGLCSRYGGDELLAIMTKPCDPIKIRQDIENYLAAYNQTSGKPYTVSVSIGIFTTEDADFEKMFAKADRLMYRDKMGKPHRRK